VLEKVLGRHADEAYALLRIVAGLCLSFHGVQKIFGVLTPHIPPVGSQIWCGGVIELVAGLVIAIGLCTSWAAFVASGTMAVAYIQFHWKGAMGKEFFPAVNGGELALIYAFLFLFVACRGSGIWSVHALRKKRAN
jgi:putative oxidoreductase